jgi:putative transposase
MLNTSPVSCWGLVGALPSRVKETTALGFTLPDEILEPIAEEGLDALPEMIRTIVNAAMQLERQRHLNAAPYERSEQRRGRANGYKPKTVATRLGKITFDVPQVRDGGFYPNALEKGLRSERALKLALAEMYVQGVVTKLKWPGLSICMELNQTRTNVARVALTPVDWIIAE